MAKVRIDITGAKEMEARLKAIGAGAPNATATALYEVANVILTDSVTNYVPKDTGALAASGKVELPVVTQRGSEVEMGFGGVAAPYALAVHENPRAGQTHGKSPQGRSYVTWARSGQRKYLETPLKAHVPEVGDALRKGIDDYVAEVAYQTGSVNVRPAGRAPRPEILEGP